MSGISFKKEQPKEQPQVEMSEKQLPIKSLADMAAELDDPVMGGTLPAQPVSDAVVNAVAPAKGKVIAFRVSLPHNPSIIDIPIEDAPTEHDAIKVFNAKIGIHTTSHKHEVSEVHGEPPAKPAP